MKKVFIVTKLSSSGTRPDFSEQETADKPSSGPIPRVVDMMVNLFLRDSGSQLTKKVFILDAKGQTTRFKEYKMKDKWNAFQSALNSLIKIDESTTAGATEFTRVEGQDKVAEGTLHSVWAKNVVNYDTILKETEGPFFNQQFKDNVKKGKLYVRQMLEWPSDVSKIPLAFQKKARIFEELSLHHVADESLLHDNLYNKLLPNLYESSFLVGRYKIPGVDNLIMEHRKTLNKCYRVGKSEERDIFVDNYDPDNKVHVKTLLQHYLLSLSCVDNVVSTPDQLEQVNLVCDKLLDYYTCSGY
eukprot:jgi/Psemu1/33904/gm1.33904_g